MKIMPRWLKSSGKPPPPENAPRAGRDCGSRRKGAVMGKVEPRWLSLEATAESIGVRPDALMRLVRAGRIRAVLPARAAPAALGSART